MDPNLVELVPGRCWWCGGFADSREHKLKRSDLVREFGPPPYYGGRTLQRVAGNTSQSVAGPNSSAFKFDASMCARCNDTRSQSFDRAWDTFTEYLVKNEKLTRECRAIDFESVFGPDWRTRAADVGRYIVKHIICRIVQELPGPIKLDKDLFDFLDGGAFPNSLQLEASLDLGVVAMLELTRTAPANDPQAAMAGFLYLGPIWADLDERQHWHTPQSGMHYRWLALYWRIGDGGAQNPFIERLLTLDPSDELFGADVRELFELQRDLPAEIFRSRGDATPLHEAVRAAGYPDIASRVEELTARINAQQQ